MSYLTKHTLFFIFGTFMLMISACTYRQNYKHQANGDEVYLKNSTLYHLKSPSDIVLPIKDKYRDIYHNYINGEIGKKLDIRPPIQPLSIINGYAIKVTNNIEKLTIRNSKNNLWIEVLKVINYYKLPLIKCNKISKELITDWILWNRADENEPYQGRYKIILKNYVNYQVLKIYLLELKQADKIINSPVKTHFYTVYMLNNIIVGLNKFNFIKIKD
ncbi:outer membrane protein assembly factor BamC [Pantoea sp. Mhis]|uniref:outer membrane protein assembly factor BamC n=1 Tax=Pantoea sp. Mhis TaxID=2576759 RepID=UPI001356AD94|nr:outer membrane protein assembly factor BamC [Pantoea sp. Mhis]MXP56587.1 outer membrane protein assembly factor BamC [Pantoea sp. Mhis]